MLFIDPFMCVIAASKKFRQYCLSGWSWKMLSFWHFCDISYGILYACLWLFLYKMPF